MDGLLLLLAFLCGVFLLLRIGRPDQQGTRSDPGFRSDWTSELKPKAPPQPRFDERNSAPPKKGRILLGRVYVVDGDTIKIQRSPVRLYGVDAPELNHPYGKKAMWALRKLCKGQVIRAEVTAEDTYGRLVARCYLPDGRDLSAEMVKQGLAIDWPKFSGGRYRDIEAPDARRKLFLADARQKGRMHVWETFEARSGKDF